MGNAAAYKTLKDAYEQQKAEMGFEASVIDEAQLVKLISEQVFIKLDIKDTQKQEELLISLISQSNAQANEPDASLP